MLTESAVVRFNIHIEYCGFVEDISVRPKEAVANRSETLNGLLRTIFDGYRKYEQVQYVIMHVVRNGRSECFRYNHVGEKFIRDESGLF